MRKSRLKYFKGNAKAMVNGNIKEFVDNLNYGAEMYFIFQEKKYFIQGWVEDDVHYLVLDYDYETEVFNLGNPEFNKYIWKCSSADSGECVQAFLDAPLWDGKKFYDVEAEITWTDP